MIEPVLSAALDLAERGLVPDAMVRAGIRQVCRQRVRELASLDTRARAARRAALLADMATGPVAPVPDVANAQHYEAPVELFAHALGPHLKYSSGYWPEGVTSLGEAEAAALSETCAHAALADGQDVLELGCGWGSLTLWMAARYPASRILAVSNSRDQRAFILRRASARGLANVEVVTADMNDFVVDRRFDRVVSVEMFEHMRNYAELLGRIAGWLHDDGRLFVHIFCHHADAYPYETDGAANWMGRHFFTGGLMPNAAIFDDFPRHLRVRASWQWDGTHYARTANAWLRNLDASRTTLMPVFERHYGRRDARRWFQRWRMFFMACAELWDYRGGHEWLVGHYQLERAATGSRSARDARDAA